jgi:uncharacterized membrane protein YphA (DoxX/SURF4 family)
MKRFSEKLPTIVRVTFGLLFLVHGVAALAGLLPQPSLPDRGLAFMQALAASGWLMPLVMGTEAVAGALLVANQAAPLALILLAPVVVGILGFHLFLAPAGAPVAIVLVALEAYLAWVHRAAWKPLFASRRSQTAHLRGSAQPA